MNDNISSSDTIQGDLWLCHISCESWCEPQRWEHYFAEVQDILGAQITQLDENDPVRKRFPANDFQGMAEYVTTFGELETSRTLFGILKKIRVDFTIRLFKPEEKRMNSIDWCFPPTYLDIPGNLEKVVELFEAGNRCLGCFYSYSDFLGQLKKKSRPAAGAVDYFMELLGIFWLTYFDHHYVAYFGREKFEGLERMGIQVQMNEGATLRLSEMPTAVPPGLRQAAEEYLGARSFVDPKDPKNLLCKRAGQYALTFEQLTRADS